MRPYSSHHAVSITTVTNDGGKKIPCSISYQDRSTSSDLSDLSRPVAATTIRNAQLKMNNMKKAKDKKDELDATSCSGSATAAPNDENEYFKYRKEKARREEMIERITREKRRARLQNERKMDRRARRVDRRKTREKTKKLTATKRGEKTAVVGGLKPSKSSAVEGAEVNMDEKGRQPLRNGGGGGEEKTSPKQMRDLGTLLCITVTGSDLSDEPLKDIKSKETDGKDGNGKVSGGDIDDDSDSIPPRWDLTTQKPTPPPHTLSRRANDRDDIFRNLNHGMATRPDKNNIDTAGGGTDANGSSSPAAPTLQRAVSSLRISYSGTKEKKTRTRKKTMTATRNDRVINCPPRRTTIDSVPEPTCVQRRPPSPQPTPLSSSLPISNSTTPTKQRARGIVERTSGDTSSISSNSTCTLEVIERAKLIVSGKRETSLSANATAMPAVSDSTGGSKSSSPSSALRLRPSQVDKTSVFTTSSSPFPSSNKAKQNDSLPSSSSSTSRCSKSDMKTMLKSPRLKSKILTALLVSKRIKNNGNRSLVPLPPPPRTPPPRRGPEGDEILAVPTPPQPPPSSLSSPPREHAQPQREKRGVLNEKNNYKVLDDNDSLIAILEGNTEEDSADSSVPSHSSPPQDNMIKDVPDNKGKAIVPSKDDGNHASPPNEVDNEDIDKGIGTVGNFEEGDTAGEEEKEEDEGIDQNDTDFTEACSNKQELAIVATRSSAMEGTKGIDVVTAQTASSVELREEARPFAKPVIPGTSLPSPNGLQEKQKTCDRNRSNSSQSPSSSGEASVSAIKAGVKASNQTSRRSRSRRRRTRGRQPSVQSNDTSSSSRFRSKNPNCINDDNCVNDFDEEREKCCLVEKEKQRLQGQEQKQQHQAHHQKQRQQEEKNQQKRKSIFLPQNCERSREDEEDDNGTERAAAMAMRRMVIVHSDSSMSSQLDCKEISKKKRRGRSNVVKNRNNIDGVDNNYNNAGSNVERKNKGTAMSKSKGKSRMNKKKGKGKEKDNNTTTIEAASSPPSTYGNKANHISKKDGPDNIEDDDAITATTAMSSSSSSSNNNNYNINTDSTSLLPDSLSLSSSLSSSSSPPNGENNDKGGSFVAVHPTEATNIQPMQNMSCQLAASSSLDSFPIRCAEIRGRYNSSSLSYSSSSKSSSPLASNRSRESGISSSFSDASSGSGGNVEGAPSAPVKVRIVMSNCHRPSSSLSSSIHNKDISFLLDEAAILRRETEMREHAQKESIPSHDWDGSLIFCRLNEVKWHRRSARSAPESSGCHYGSRGGSITRQWPSTGSIVGNSTKLPAPQSSSPEILEIVLNPQEETGGGRQLFLRPSLVVIFLETYYRTGKIHVSDDMSMAGGGRQTHETLKYFGIIHPPPTERTYESFGGYIRVKIWEDYLQRRETLANSIAHHCMKSTKMSHCFFTSPEYGTVSDMFYSVNGRIADVFDGGKLSPLPSSSSSSSSSVSDGTTTESSRSAIHNFFTGDDPYGPSAVAMRSDFAEFLASYLAGTTVRFDVQEVIANRSEGAIAVGNAGVVTEGVNNSNGNNEESSSRCAPSLPFKAMAAVLFISFHGGVAADAHQGHSNTIDEAELPKEGEVKKNGGVRHQEAQVLISSFVNEGKKSPEKKVRFASPPIEQENDEHAPLSSHNDSVFDRSDASAPDVPERGTKIMERLDLHNSDMLMGILANTLCRRKDTGRVDDGSAAESGATDANVEESTPLSSPPYMMTKTDPSTATDTATAALERSGSRDSISDSDCDNDSYNSSTTTGNRNEERNAEMNNNRNSNKKSNHKQEELMDELNSSWLRGVVVLPFISCGEREILAQLNNNNSDQPPRQ